MEHAVGLRIPARAAQAAQPEGPTCPSPQRFQSRSSRSSHHFLVLEMFLWERPRTRAAFGMSAEQAAQTKVLAANQGLYKGSSRRD
jgi:hypothetical protein